ncbi:hypothetical protein KQX54_005656 [Cotesia glomerata]|uniref:Uncharacterized protein n=1 Tax=Cotesia glomerata TaxID=32391 RepID=A0AAV7IBU2_COTGL|nr:hypothetical protein KQX54_005656 [Cotesia glomerata]
MNKLTQAINVKIDRLMIALLKSVPKMVQSSSLMNKLIQDVSKRNDQFEISEDIPETNTMYDPDTLCPSENATDNCNQFKVPQQQLYDLYEIVVLSEVEGFVMTSYSFAFVATIEDDLNRAFKQVVSRSKNYLFFTIEALKKLPRELFLCDPPKHVEGETYFKINALRRVLVHKSMIDKSTSCSSTCNNIDTRKYEYHDDKSKTELRPNNPCRGRISGCQDIGESQICEQPANSESWHSWIQSDIGTFGDKDSCNGRTYKALNNTYIGFYKCTSCFCLCSEENADLTAIRTFSLRPQIADIKNNMVVTGVRFELQDNVVHVQIQQSKMLAASSIQANSTKLVELEKFVYMNNVTGGAFVIQNGSQSIPLVEGTDYSWIRSGQQDINLDSLYIQEPGWCVTGLRKKIDVEDRDVPTKHENSEYSNDFEGTSFAPTEKWHGMGQKTISFFDKRLVASDPPVPLDRVTLDLGSSEKSGGMLGFKISALNRVLYLNKTMVQKNMIGDNSIKAAI